MTPTKFDRMKLREQIQVIVGNTLLTDQIITLIDNSLSERPMMTGDEIKNIVRKRLDDALSQTTIPVKREIWAEDIARALSGKIPAPEKVSPETCQCKHEPGSAIPVDDVKNPICPKCLKPLLAPPQSDAGAELKTKISGASGFERGASCVKCLKPLSTTRGGGQPEDFWHEYYKDIITQINDDHTKLMSEKEAEIERLRQALEKIVKIFYDMVGKNEKPRSPILDIATVALKKGE